MKLLGHKVVLAEEMARVEKLNSNKEQAFMENAGAAVARVVETFYPKQKITLFVGKGNNGGDAYAAGVCLLQKGFSVAAFPFFSLESCSPLSKMQHERFIQAGGTLTAEVKEGVILDGLVGTGFKGKAEGVLKEAIDLANNSKLPIIAIDIPSGVNGTTGAVETVAIYATKTVYLGLAKLGLFFKEGWNHTGEPVFGDFGLPKESIEEAKQKAYLISEENLKAFFPPPKRDQHKYERGYVVALAGSSSMAGAAILSSFSTLRAGAGIVRLFHFNEMDMAGVPEIIHEKIDAESQEKILNELKRAKAAFIGPGLGRTKEAEALTSFFLNNVQVPVVIDADALYFLSQNPSFKIPSHAVLTPHHGEMEKLLGKKYKDHLELLDAAQKFVEEKSITLVLKGSPTCILHPKASPLIIPRGTPGMATAGSGDVLTGIIAAFLAHGHDPFTAASLGVYFHALAGELAAKEHTSYSLIASDIIEALPKALAPYIN